MRALLANLAEANLDTEAPNLTAAEAARGHLKRALELHERVGVKKELERLERALKT